MKFKGTIVITDPCYLVEEKDWDRSGWGSNLEALGLNTYITESTIYGDWGCTTFATKNPKKVVDDLAEISQHFHDNYSDELSDEEEKALCVECDEMQDSLNLKLEKLGNFAADAGLVSVFLLDEASSYNPGFLRWAEDHPWCVTIIDDFSGDVEYYVDQAGNAHIIGTGSIDFFTTQTGL